MKKKKKKIKRKLDLISILKAHPYLEHPYQGLQKC